MESILARPEAMQPTMLRAMALNAGARLADNQNDWAAVRAYCVEIIAIQERLGNLQGLSGKYVLLAKAASAEDDFDAARDLLETGVEVARAAGDDLGYAHCANGLGELARLLGDYDTARYYYESCLAIFRNAGHSQGIGFVLHNLAHVYLHDGDHAGRRLCWTRRWPCTGCWATGSARRCAAVSGVALGQGVAQRAARLLGAAQALESVGALLDPADVMEYRHNEATARARLGEAAFLVAWAEGHAMTPEQVTAIEGVLEVTQRSTVMSPQRRAPAPRRPPRRHPA